MRTLALYNNDNGEQQQAVITHENTTFPDFEELLPEYNPDGSLFLINLYDDDERPDVVDEFLNEVPCHFVSF